MENLFEFKTLDSFDGYKKIESAGKLGDYLKQEVINYGDVLKAKQLKFLKDAKLGKLYFL